jgi:hypothetical protein
MFIASNKINTEKEWEKIVDKDDIIENYEVVETEYRFVPKKPTVIMAVKQTNN